jgi:3-(3-hydroxy-phenyl)propionate hydroxylase
MCAGIRDAANLAWKLRDIVAGRAKMSLLDTYQSERAPHVREFIELAIRLGGVINNTKAKEAGLASGEARKDAPVKLEVFKPLLGPGLAIGDLPLAGHLAPQFALTNGRRSDDRTGYTNVLLVERATALSPRIHSALLAAGVEVLTSDDAADLLRWFREHDIKAALVRPDRYVLGAARSEADLDPLVASICFPAPVPTAA